MIRASILAFGLAMAVSLLPLRAARSAAADGVIGFVKTSSGEASVRHGDEVARAHPGVPIHVADVLETGSDGALGVTFKDDTRIALGPSSRVVVPAFVFEPADQKYGFVLRIVNGTMQYISGLTAKLAPDTMSIETPTATIGVRGTRLLVRAGG